MFTQWGSRVLGEIDCLAGKGFLNPSRGYISIVPGRVSWLRGPVRYGEDRQIFLRSSEWSYFITVLTL